MKICYYIFCDDPKIFIFLYYWVTQVMFFRVYDYKFLELDRVHGNWLFRNRYYDFYTYLYIGRSYLRESRLDVLFPKKNSCCI